MSFTPESEPEPKKTDVPIKITLSEECSSWFRRVTSDITADLTGLLRMYGENSDIGNLQSDVEQMLKTEKLRHHMAGVTADQGKPRVTIRAVNERDVCTVRVMKKKIGATNRQRAQVTTIIASTPSVTSISL